MAEMRTIKFPGDTEPREIVDAKAREELKDKIDNTELSEAINTALAQAKESGEFDGADGQDGYTPQKGVDYFDGVDGQDGFSPIMEVSTVEGGHNVKITDAHGEKTFVVMDGPKGEDGKDYILTEADKTEIAEQAAVLLDTAIADAIGTGVLE